MFSVCPGKGGRAAGKGRKRSRAFPHRRAGKKRRTGKRRDGLTNTRSAGIRRQPSRAAGGKKNKGPEEL